MIWLLPHPFSLSRRHTRRQRKRDNLLMGDWGEGGGRGAEVSDGKIAWSSINHSILSVARVCKRHQLVFTICVMGSNFMLENMMFFFWGRKKSSDHSTTFEDKSNFRPLQRVLSCCFVWGTPESNSFLFVCFLVQYVHTVLLSRSSSSLDRD